MQAKLEGIKIKDVALKANKSSKQGSTSKSKINQQASTSKPTASKQVQERVETTSSSESENKNDDDQYEKIDDVALFMKRFHKRLKKQGYKVVKIKFPNKYNCGSTNHVIAKCPYEIKDNKYKKDKKEDKTDHRKNKKYMGEAHIGYE